MKLVRVVAWGSLGLLLSAGMSYAQEDAQVAGKAGKVTQSEKQGAQAADEAREKPLREAEELLRSGKPEEAYSLLEPLEFERAGEARFDYLIGIAALDSGKPDKATLAFERVLAVDPNFAGARLDMARAYYQMGDFARAQAEFQAVLKLNPPEAARATISKYLDAIAEQEAARQTKVTGYLEATAGNDSNVNASTSQVQVNIPALGNLPVTLSAANVKSADNYAGVAAGGEINHDFSPGFGIYAGADVRQRGNMSRTNFDSFSLDGRAGFVFGAGDDVVRLGMQRGQYTLGSLRNRDSLGVNAEWRHTFSSSNQLTVFGQNNQYRFVDNAMKTNDFDQDLVGAGWAHVLESGKSVLFGSLYYGNEKDVASGGRVDGSKRLDGVRLGGQTVMGDSTEVFASLGWQEGIYFKTNAMFLRARRDRLSDLTLGANWHWDKLWTVRPQLNYSRNGSNIPIYSYDRTDLSITLRREFK